METIKELLGAEGLAELRSKVIDMIVDVIRSDFEHSECYLCSPEDIASDIYDDIKNEVLAEIRMSTRQELKLMLTISLKRWVYEIIIKERVII